MLDLRTADVTQTRFYQQVLQIGEKTGEFNLVIRLLNRRCGNLTASQVEKIKTLSISQLELLGEALLDFQHLADLEHWLEQNQ
jgi:predicted transposase YdaD